MEHHTQIVTNADELQDAVKCGNAQLSLRLDSRTAMLALQPGQS